MNIHTYRINKDKDHGWWICEIGIKKYKLINITYWYFSFLFWGVCVEIRKNGGKNE